MQRRNRFVRSAQGAQHLAEVVVELRFIGRGGERAVDQLQRHVMAADLVGEHAEQVHRAEMIRGDRENLPVNRFRLREFATLVVSHRQLDGLLDRDVSTAAAAHAEMFYHEPRDAGKTAGANRVTMNTSPASRLDAAILRFDATAAAVHKIAADAMRLGVACVVAPPVWTARLAVMLRSSEVQIGSLVSYPEGTSKPTIKAIEASSTIKDGAQRIEIVPHHALFLAAEPDGARAELIEIARAARATRRDVHLATRVDLEMLLHRRGERAVEIACRATRESGFDGIVIAGAANPATDELLAVVRNYAQALTIKVSKMDDSAEARSILAAGADRIETEDPEAVLRDSGN